MPSQSITNITLSPNNFASAALLSLPFKLMPSKSPLLASTRDISELATF